MICEYVHQNYGVPACIGMRVSVYGKPGVIAEDRGHYIGVNFDDDKPGVVKNCHPTDGVEYLMESGKIRKITRSQARYQRFLIHGDVHESFMDFCRYEDWKRRN